MDRRDVLGDRRVAERRAPSFRPAHDERRSGRERRQDDRRAWSERRRVDDRGSRRAHPTGGRRRTDIVLPPLSRLVPALVLVAVSLANLAVAQATGTKGWSLLLVATAFPIAAYDLANPWRWKWHLGVVWFAVGVYVTVAGVHIATMLTG